MALTPTPTSVTPGFVLTGTQGYPMPWISSAMLQFDPALQQLIADRVFPFFGVQQKQGEIPRIRREDFLRVRPAAQQEMAIGAAYERDVQRTDNIPFNCGKFGKEGQVTQESQAFFRQIFDAQLMMAKRIFGQLALEREALVASMLFNTTTWPVSGTTGVDVSSTAPWTTLTTDIPTAMAAAITQFQLNCGLKPNAIILNSQLLRYIANNSVVKGRFTVTPNAQIAANVTLSKEMLVENFATIFDPSIKHVLEAGAIYNKAGEGQTMSGGYVWSSDYVMLARIAETEDMTEPCLGRTMRWNVMDNTGQEFFGYPEPQTDSDIIKGRSYKREIVLDSAFGYLMKVSTL